ncbi:hypothetical protein MMYC01_205449 [Madurella mycetomatis]|uniref:Uncharacterized protein n=1 Tax=Madurella mycetomatis TaxID=100816 RepID=A0A175W4D9_9PEZI|nr:hypothetical protein MMYC01_205449 [Madurella mycetomatis]
MEVSHESRAVAERHDEKLSLACAVEVRGPPPPAPYIYFHPKMDILCQAFEYIIGNFIMHRARRPGTKMRVILPNDFEDILRNPNPFNLDTIRHIHVNIPPIVTYVTARDNTAAGRHPPLASTLLVDGAITYCQAVYESVCYSLRIDARSMVSFDDDNDQRERREYIWCQMLDTGLAKP